MSVRRVMCGAYGVEMAFLNDMRDVHAITLHRDLAHSFTLVVCGGRRGVMAHADTNLFCAYISVCADSSRAMVSMFKSCSS